MDDPISRQAAIDLAEDLIRNVYSVGRGGQREREVIRHVIDGIRQLPPVQSERKKGKWVGADSQCGIGCPFCGTPVDDFCSSIDYIDLRYKPNYCPNCGVDMRGEQDEI